MPDDQPVTIWWLRVPPDDLGYCWQYNHVEIGRSELAKPDDPFRRGWARSTWDKTFGRLGPPGKFGAPVLIHDEDDPLLARPRAE